MNVFHLTDSPFFGGPERQMLGLAVSLQPAVRTTVLCFREPPLCLPFIAKLTEAGVPSRMLPRPDPRLDHIVSDLVAILRAEDADVLVCHGYKADIVGLIAARIARVPVASVSRGWTGHTRKVRLFESIDRQILRRMDAVVCVSDGQAAKVRRTGVAAERLHVIHNAIDTTRFDRTEHGGRATLAGMFTTPPDFIVLGVGRLSPEKGFDQLVEAARIVAAEDRSTGFVIIGDGPDRQQLEQQVKAARLDAQVVFAGFRSDVDFLLPGADVLAQASYTEGLPNVVLEAGAAGVPVVATNVGGTGEVIRDGENGYLIPSGDPRTLADRILALRRSASIRRAMGAAGREVVREHFSFATQSAAYGELLASLGRRGADDHVPAAMPVALSVGSE